MDKELQDRNSEAFEFLLVIVAIIGSIFVSVFMYVLIGHLFYFISNMGLIIIHYRMRRWTTFILFCFNQILTVTGIFVWYLSS